jgi:hypothetical protein
MSGFRIEGNTSGNVAEVDASNNLKANLPAVQAQAGFATMQVELDSGAIRGSRYLKAPFVSEDRRLAVGLDTELAQFNFTPLAQNTGDFKHAFATMTMTQSGGFLNINPALATVSGNYAMLQSWRHFSLLGDGTVHCEMIGQLSAMPPSNQIFECGLFWGTAGVAPADGVFFRLTAAGLVGVMSYNGAETVTGVMAATLPANSNAKYTIIVAQSAVEFWLDGVLGGDLDVPVGQAVPYQTLNLPWCAQMRNAGTVVGGATVKMGTVHITQNDLGTYKPWAYQMALQGNAYQGQEGDTQGSLAAYSNSALSAAAALTNTTAAAPNTGLGGVVLVAPTLTAGTDGILFSYLNPVGGVNQPPKTLVVTGVSIDAGVQAAITGGPLNLVCGIAYGHTALSLATAETGSFVTATTKAPRRVPLGVLNFPITAPAGSTAVEICRQFESPIVVNPGEYFQITVRNVGTVTSAGALVMTSTVDHYFE